jgi:integrase/recombinase XerD
VPASPKTATDLSALTDGYRLCARAEGKSPRTIELTTLALRKLKAFLEEMQLPTDAAMLRADDIWGFILHLQACRKFENHPYAKIQEQGLSPQAINCYMRSIRAAWNRWLSEGLVELTLFDRVKVPRAPKKVIPTFSPQQLDALLGAIDTSTPTGFRDYTLISTYLDTSCRLAEVTNLMMEDVDLKGRCLRVMGKGGRERVVPIGATVLKLLWKYINIHRPEPVLPQCEYLFLTRDGRRLTNNRVEAIMKRYAEKAGITGLSCSPHTLRHTACLMWIRNGGDIFSLQRMTGHSNLNILREYVSLAQTDVDAAHRRYSPVDNLKIGGRHAKT